MSDRATYVAPIWKNGASVVMPLYKLLTRALGILPGDMVLIRVHQPYFTVRLLNPNEQIPLETFTADDLPRNVGGDRRDR